MKLFKVYENATSNDEPLQKVFRFDAETVVSYNKKETVIAPNKFFSVSVKRKTSVYANNHPVHIMNKGR